MIIHALMGRLRAAAEYVAQNRRKRTRKDTEVLDLFWLGSLDFLFPLKLLFEKGFQRLS